MALHGRVTISDPTPRPAPTPTSAARSASSSTASRSSAATTSSCAPSANRNAQDHLLDGRSATIERIYVDYDDQRPPRA